MGSYQDQLTAEAKSWLIEDPRARDEKLLRERIRHPKLIRDLLLDKLPTSGWDVLEVGGGPEPVSDLLDYRYRVVIDPLCEDYAVFPRQLRTTYLAIEAENSTLVNCFDLVISTNSLDHVRSPGLVLENMDRALRPGGYMAIMCAENNAITNPHPCHVINLTAKDVHSVLDRDYETCWELTYERDGYRYGWASWEGKRGQPAFAMLMRKAVGY